MSQLNIRFITGADLFMFAQMFALLQSFDDFGRKDMLSVADFGFDDAQRRFLDARGQRIAIPMPKSAKHHPWWYKASLVDFIAKDTDVVVWVDADMIALCDPFPPVLEAIAKMEAQDRLVAACPDTSETMAGLVAVAANHGHQCPGFLRNLRQFNIDMACTYLNSGFFIARSRRWLKEWKRNAHQTQNEFVWEQNAFNIAAWKDPNKVHLLDVTVWNVHGENLNRLVSDGNSLSCGDKPAIFVHSTAPQPEGIYEKKVMGWPANGQIITATVRFFLNAQLRQRQNALIESFVNASRPQLDLAWK